MNQTIEADEEYWRQTEIADNSYIIFRESRIHNDVIGGRKFQFYTKKQNFPVAFMHVKFFMELYVWLVLFRYPLLLLFILSFPFIFG